MRAVRVGDRGRGRCRIGNQYPRSVYSSRSRWSGSRSGFGRKLSLTVTVRPRRHSVGITHMPCGGVRREHGMIIDIGTGSTCGGRRRRAVASTITTHGHGSDVTGCSGRRTNAFHSVANLRDATNGWIIPVGASRRLSTFALLTDQFASFQESLVPDTIRRSSGTASDSPSCRSVRWR